MKNIMNTIMRNKHTFGRCCVIALVLPLLGGCGIYTNYQRPDNLPVDRLYRDIAVTERDTSSIADLSWRELFTDPCLVRWI